MSSGSRVLRKAKSFRDELKTKLIRKATSVPRGDAVSSVVVFPNTGKCATRLSRPSSRSSVEEEVNTNHEKGDNLEHNTSTDAQLPPTGKRRSLSRGMSFNEGKKMDRHDLVSSAW